MAKAKPIDYDSYFKQAEAVLDVTFTSEYRFDSERKYRFDYAVICCQLAIEIQGGSFGGKGHKSFNNYLSDQSKFNLAAIHGWRVLYFPPQMMENLEFLTTLERFYILNPCTHKSQATAWELLKAI